MIDKQDAYDAVAWYLEADINHLEAEIDQLKATLALLKELRATPIDRFLTATRPSDIEIRHDSFFEMTYVDAVKKYLGMMGRPQSTKEIADALERGGINHSSKNFAATIRSILCSKKEFIRVNGDWALSVWHPDIRKEDTKLGASNE